VSLLIKPERREIPFGDNGETKTFILSNFPAIAGREIVTQYPLSALPKLGDYARNEELMLKVMSHVAVDIEGREVVLNSRALIDNHVPDFECLMRIEAAMMEKNCSFFRNGKLSTFSERIVETARTLISQTLTGSSRQSSEKS